MIKEYTAFFPCCGSGGAAIGAAKAISEFKGHVGRFRVVGGIDVVILSPSRRSLPGTG